MPTRDQTLDLLASAIGEKYEVLQWIGGGGMAEVYLARHRVHGGLFAVKVLAEHLSSDSVIVDRFLQEARTAASLSGHAHIVPIFDIGQEQQLHYLIMQYVDGEDLASYLEREGPLSPPAAAQVIMQVAKALIWAHSKGVVHRDLKPANIRLDRYGRVIVLDFGIAKASDVPSALTSMGERLGTPFYMAPEQVRGEVCDARSDLYSLGVVFFELLTGKRPFGGESYRAIEHAQLYTEPPSPSETNPEIGPEYSSVVLKLLAKDPADRYQSAGDLIDVLKMLDPGHETTTLQPQISEEIRQWTEAPAPPSSRVERTETPRPPAAPPPPMPPPRKGGSGSKAWIIFAGGGVVIALALGLAIFSTHKPKPAADTVTSTKTVAEPSALAQRIDTPTGTMLLVAAGPFQFGSTLKESPNPQQLLTLPNFYVDSTEVSNAEYKKFCDATGQPAPDPVPGDEGYFLSKPNYPVVNVTLADAKAFASWAGKRLPTEQEWEKAARGTDGRVYPWGSDASTAKANMTGSQSAPGPMPVDSMPEGASPSGARNMAGNVWEWTVDPYPVTAREIADMKKVAGSAGNEWNVIKGGHFASTELWLRTYMRRGFPLTSKSPYIGFRCVKDAK